MGSRRGHSRHRVTARGHWTHRVAGLPWVTFVLTALAALLVLALLTPDEYESTATVTATTSRAAEVGAVALSRPSLVREVEDAVELDPDRRGRVRLAVDHPAGEPDLHVTARARDPRLAALAADTAAALVVTDAPDTLSLSAPGVVPARPSGRVAAPWVALGLLALAGAMLLEVRHERWERANPPLRTTEVLTTEGEA